MSLSARIMNLPEAVSDIAADYLTRADAYLAGHRDARRSAAELAAEADAIRDELVAALEAAEVGLVISGADKPQDGDFVPTPKLALRQVRAALARAKGQQA